MKTGREEEMKIEKEQEVHLLEEGDTERIALTMNMTEEGEEGEEVTHQRQDTEEKISALTNEGGAQGPLVLKGPL